MVGTARIVACLVAIAVGATFAMAAFLHVGEFVGEAAAAFFFAHSRKGIAGKQARCVRVTNEVAIVRRLFHVKLNGVAVASQKNL